MRHWALEGGFGSTPLSRLYKTVNFRSDRKFRNILHGYKPALKKLQRERQD
jgi:hypothetical protein